MGFFGAIGSCYKNILNFSGRARRSEYWFFVLFQILIVMITQAVLVAYLVSSPDMVEPLRAAVQDAEKATFFIGEDSEYRGLFLGSWLAYIVLLWLPHLSTMVRRLHDTDHRGWWIFFPVAVSVASGFAAGFGTVFLPNAGMAPMILGTIVVPLASSLYILILLCRAGTEGPNRFGPDPIAGGRRKTPAHPAFARDRDPEDQRAFEAQRRAEIRQLYQTRVLGGNRA